MIKGKKGDREMGNYVKVGNLQVAKLFYEFMNNEVLPGSGLDHDRFWADFEALVKDLTPKNKALLARRDEIQEKLNTWHKEHRGTEISTLKNIKHF